MQKSTKENLILTENTRYPLVNFNTDPKRKESIAFSKAGNESEVALCSRLPISLMKKVYSLTTKQEKTI